MWQLGARRRLVWRACANMLASLNYWHRVRAMEAMPALPKQLVPSSGLWHVRMTASAMLWPRRSWNVPELERPCHRELAGSNRTGSNSTTKPFTNVSQSAHAVTIHLKLSSTEAAHPLHTEHSPNNATVIVTAPGDKPPLPSRQQHVSQ